MATFQFEIIHLSFILEEYLNYKLNHKFKIEFVAIIYL